MVNHIQDLFLAVAIPEIVGEGGQCFQCIGHHLPPNCRFLFEFLVNRVGKTLLILVEGPEATCETICCQKS